MPPYEMASSGKKLSEGNVSFLKDIQLMMYGLGDCSQPPIETAQLVEEIVIRQMVCVVNLAEETAHLRGHESIAPNDILFLMRNNREGLKRLINYLGVKDETQMLNKSFSQTQGDIEAAYLSDENSNSITWQGSRKLYCYEFLKSIGIEELDIERIEDKVKQERLLRANRATLQMSEVDYKSFQAARQVSFGATPTKFVKWLRQKGHILCELKPTVLEIMVYLAKETIARIIDKVLTVREESALCQVIGITPITVNEIQEVIRMHCQLQSVKLSIFSRDILNYLETRLIVI